jgi:conjugative transfer signal peptidase TraF
VKPVAAIAGDLVTITAAGFAVNGKPMADTAQLGEDSAGRPLQPIPAGTYRVPAGAVWLLSGHDPRSFDSRYFGAVPAANIQGIARPVWVIQ